MSTTYPAIVADMLELARLYRQEQRFRDAEDVYAELVELYDEDADLLMEAAELPVARGEGVQALRWLYRAMRVVADDTPVRTAVATVLLQSGQREAAAWQWFRVARQRPGFAHAWAILHAIAATCGRARIMQYASERMDRLLTVEERRAHLAEAWLQVAGAAVIRDALDGGQVAEPVASPLTAMLSRARDVLANHASMHGSHADVHYHLARCEAALGHPTAARTAVDLALHINPRYAAASALRDELAA
jgi:tetratricopeptide (TPR) repeat protein